jgi:hypothetical protein
MTNPSVSSNPRISSAVCLSTFHPIPWIQKDFQLLHQSEMEISCITKSMIWLQKWISNSPSWIFCLFCLFWRIRNEWSNQSIIT